MDGAEIVKRARQLERLMARRRRLVATVEELNVQIREARKFLQQLAEPPRPELHEGELQ